MSPLEYLEWYRAYWPTGLQIMFVLFVGLIILDLWRHRKGGGKK